MEANRTIILDTQSVRNDKATTYVFNIKDEVEPDASVMLGPRLCQIFPAICGSTMCISFGMMLGWPSPMNPILLARDSPVPITIDQSAMVAGFLMIGNSVGTPFSFIKRPGAKYGLMIAIILMTLGWIVMWQAMDLYWLLLSRFLVGLGHGYGNGQLKIYLREMCEDSLVPTLTKQINLYTFFGVVVAFVIGPFVDFRRFSIFALIITILILFLVIFLPSTPRELLKGGNEKDAKKLIVFLSPHLNVDEELSRIRQDLEKPGDELGFCDILKNEATRRNFGIFSFLVFFQQFTGIAATVIYSQILFTASHCPSPEFCALLYGFTYFLSNIYGIFYSPNFNKKYMLLFSSISVSVLLSVQIIVIIYKANDNLWSFTSLIVMLIYVIVHTVGLGNVPFTLIPEFFPKSGNKVVVQFFVIFHSLLALLITKILQVMYDRIGLFSPFCLFLGVSLTSIIFILLFLPRPCQK